MLRINLDNKVFRAIGNSLNGEVSGATKFHYRQKEDIIWAEYEGGDIKKGFLVGKVGPDAYHFTYQHVNASGDIMTGKCRSTPERLPDGRLRLHEEWQWTSGDHSSGASIVEELS